MWVAINPARFEIEEQNACARYKPGTRKRWRMLGEEFDENPLQLVGPAEYAMLRLWSRAREGNLPDEGAGGDQPAIMGDAFGIMTAFERGLLKMAGPKTGH